MPNAQAPCNTSLPIRSLRPRKTASVDCDDEEVFEVSHLEGFVNEDGVYMYYVRWAPPYSHECTLEPLDNIFDAGLIVAFHRRDVSMHPMALNLKLRHIPCINFIEFLLLLYPLYFGHRPPASFTEESNSGTGCQSSTCQGNLASSSKQRPQQFSPELKGAFLLICV